MIASGTTGIDDGAVKGCHTGEILHTKMPSDFIQILIYGTGRGMESCDDKRRNKCNLVRRI